MLRKLLLLGLICNAVLAGARDKQGNWLEIRSQHFVVFTNGNEKQGRHVADQFERMRAMFHLLFPKVQIDPPIPVIVLALKDADSFRALEPPEYLQAGATELAGLFQRSADKNYVLLRLDAPGDHPYATVYHEYTHLIMSKIEDWMPLWLNEGLAEFYSTTEIHDKDFNIGKPKPWDLELLRHQKMLPLSTLFTVDHSSPYYHQRHGATIFYAESWALTHYLEQKDYHEKTHHIIDYEDLVAKKVDSISAATQAFGDLKQLQYALESYVSKYSFLYLQMPTSIQVDDSAVTVRSFPALQAECVRADFLVHDGRLDDAKKLLDRILQEDPTNVAARESHGLLAFRQGQFGEAKKWFGEAVQLDSQSFLAHYYFAAMSMTGIGLTEDADKIETSLRTSIHLNAFFAPAYEALGMLLLRDPDKLNNARSYLVSAIQLDPGNFAFRMNYASLLMQQRKPKDAADVIRQAMHLAKPEEAVRAQVFLDQADKSAARANNPAPEITTTATDETPRSQSTPREEAPPDGPHKFLNGTLKNVHCDLKALSLSLVSARESLDLHAGNYFKIQFSTLGFNLPGDVNPCRDLEGRPAKVEFIQPQDESAAAWVVSIELHK